MDRRSDDLLTGLLKEVSRSFYLTLRALPVSIRPQIGLAYLLARASDTIADTEAIPREQRLSTLSAFREQMVRRDTSHLQLGRLPVCQGSQSEKALLERLDELFLVLTSFAPDDQERIGQVLDIILSGQMLDLERFAGASSSQVTPLETDEQLDDYTYRVAGCVGEFWTKMCRVHLYPKAPLDDGFLMRNGVRFGKGLQLTNILRDIPGDLRLGRCYLPRQRLEEFGIAPSDLLDPAAEPVLRPLFQQYVGQAEAHLRAGWDYTNHLPFRTVRIRLACAWPILIGMRTLAKLRLANVLDPANRVKVSRSELRGLIARSILLYPVQSRWRKLLPATHPRD
jgi:farnesyl-diphosphate farnesyltransferase